MLFSFIQKILDWFTKSKKLTNLKEEIVKENDIKEEPIIEQEVHIDDIKEELIKEEKNMKLNEESYKKAAEYLGVEIATIKAVKEVESGKYGAFFEEGKPVILFEGHIFWQQLKSFKLDPEKLKVGNEDILYPKWDKTKYKGGIKEYDRLNKAIKINSTAALKSASWGMFQIMGFNYTVCGCATVEDFVAKNKESETEQLLLFCAFIKKGGLSSYLKNKDWAGFAKKYNGPAYAQNNYDVKLENAYKKYSI